MSVKKKLAALIWMRDEEWWNRKWRKVEGWNFEAVACSSNKSKRTHRYIVGILKGSTCLWSWYLPDYISLLLLDHKGQSGTGIRCKADSCLLHDRYKLGIGSDSHIPGIASGHTWLVCSSILVLILVLYTQIVYTLCIGTTLIYSLTFSVRLIVCF